MSAFTFSKADHREELVQRLIFKLCVLQLAVKTTSHMLMHHLK